VLGTYLLGGQEDRFGLAEVDVDVAALEAVDDAGDDVALLAGVLLEDDFALGLTQTLEDDLLGRLGGDAAGVLGEDLDADRVAEVGAGRELARFFQRDLGAVVLDVVFGFDDGLLGEDAHATIFAIDLDGEVHVREVVLLVGRRQRCLDGFEDDLLGEVLLGRELRDRGEEVVLEGACCAPDRGGQRVSP
jgi:hypothetical protein